MRELIITAELHGHWTPWFAGHAEAAFGGETEDTAIRRLRENPTDNANAKAGIRGPDLARK